MECICDKSICTGCGVCENICPLDAIKMMPNSFLGHTRPSIDSEICVDCGICEGMCPQNYNEEVSIPIHTYAAWNKDSKLKKGCSSGGIATGIYHHFIENGWYVVGTYMDNKVNAKMKLTKEKDELEMFKGSKYVQVDTEEIYNDILQKLKEGENVLFVGLPCHCAAVKKLCKKYKEQLVLIDLICHGVPSKQTLESYVNYLEKKYGEEADKLSFRDESFGVVFQLTNSEGKVWYKRKLHEDPYMEAFIKGNLFADSCYNCIYASSERIGDITLGDFWGLGDKVPFNHKVGRVSVVLVNSEKGESLLNKLPKNIGLEKRSFQEARDGNEQLYKPSSYGEYHLDLLNLSKIENTAKAIDDIFKKQTTENFNKRIKREKIKFILNKVGIVRIYKRLKNNKYE